MNWSVLFYCLGAGLMAWLSLRIIRGNPELFSRHNLSKGFYTLGVLALLLILVVAVCIKLVR